MHCRWRITTKLRGTPPAYHFLCFQLLTDHARVRAWEWDYAISIGSAWRKRKKDRIAYKRIINRVSLTCVRFQNGAISAILTAPVEHPGPMIIYRGYSSSSSWFINSLTPTKPLHWFCEGMRSEGRKEWGRVRSTYIRQWLYNMFSIPIYTYYNV